MALTKCADCGTDHSTEAAACPRCGRLIHRPATNLRKVLKWICGGLAGLGAVLVFGGSREKDMQTAQVLFSGGLALFVIFGIAWGALSAKRVM